MISACRRRSSAVSVMVVALLLSSCLLLTIGTGVQAKASESFLLDLRLDGPTVIGTEQNTSFVLRIAYEYPERILNYSFTAEVIGALTVGAKVTPSNGTSDKGVFDIHIMGPARPGKLTVRVNASANEMGEVSWYRVNDFELEVVTPVMIFATLHNLGEIAVKDVPVKFYVDDDLKDTKYYNIAAGGSTSVSFNWTFSTIRSGEHRVKLVVDDEHGIVEFSEGNNVLEQSIYYSKAGNPLRGVISVMIIFAVVMLILTLIQKPPPRKK